MSSLSIANYFPFAGVKVVRQAVHPDASGTLVYLEPDQRYRPRCHECGASGGQIHSKGHRRILRDLAIADRHSYLHVEYRKVWCWSCGGVRVERLDFAEASCRVTQRLARYIYELCKELPVTSVAKHLGLDPKTVKAVDRMFLEQEFGATDCTSLSILAIDEIAVRRGHNYMTVVLDYQTGRVVWMGEERTKETLDGFFGKLTAEQKAGIQAVAMDMWEPFINRVQHHCPQASIVFDLFHLVSAFGHVIDEVRRSEYRKANQPGREVIKGSRYLLLKNAANLKNDQRAELKDLLAVNATLAAVHALKDQLKEIYDYSRRAWAKRSLDAWCDMASQIDHPDVQRFVARLRRYEYGILNHCDFPIGTSKLEGVNNKIKVIKRRAYGYHDPEYFALKVKQAFPGQSLHNFSG
jgi:transposase